MKQKPPRSVEKIARDYIRAAVDVGVSYESATREEANELDREVDVLIARLTGIIWSRGGPTSAKGGKR